ncbi:MAG: aspartyl protease family protein [candidate division Zixibacteria bacterium]|nr:aspartyl protease family protein [candidate division Zixibacteria bacterium]
MKRCWLALMIFIIIPLLVIYSTSFAIQNTGEVVIGDKTEYVVPLELDGHTLIVPVKLNGTDSTYHFIFDTGGLTFVNPELADYLNLEHGMSVPTYDKDIKAYSTVLETVDVGGAKVNNLVGVVFDFLRQAGFTEYDGMIGTDFASFFNVTIDYRAKTLTFSHHVDSLDTVSGTYYASMTRQKMMGAPMADGMINGHIPAECMIDVGSPYGIVMPLSWMDVLYGYQISHLIPSVGVMARWPYSEDKPNYLGRLKSLSLGQFTIDNVPVIFADVHDILIGRNILDQFITVLNYPTNQMRIIPYEDMRFDNNVFSVGVRIRLDDNNVMRVTGLWKDSPADRAGLKPGDEVVSVNQRDINAYKPADLSAILANDSVTTITITVRTDSGSVTHTLEKENLLPEIAE